jgi:carbon starvation protein CstA
MPLKLSCFRNSGIDSVRHRRLKSEWRGERQQIWNEHVDMHFSHPFSWIANFIQKLTGIHTGRKCILLTWEEVCSLYSKSLSSNIKTQNSRLSSCILFVHSGLLIWEWTKEVLNNAFWWVLRKQMMISMKE